MSRLTYNKVFTRFRSSFSHKLDEQSYSFYKWICLHLPKRFLSGKERASSFDDMFMSLDKGSPDMPDGFDYISGSVVDGKIELKYLDFFDFLPKEDLDSFIKRLRHFAFKNKEPHFSFFYEEDAENLINQFGRYYDGHAYSRIYAIELAHNHYLERYAKYIFVSLHNLSSSFIAVKYRVYIGDELNQELRKIQKTKYPALIDISRRIRVPWYKPWKFGQKGKPSSIARLKDIYRLLTKIKWEIFKEIKKNMRVYFAESGIFPPCFATYNTNIRPYSDHERLEFWRSIGLSMTPDFSQPYNLCVSWDDEICELEGVCISAYCGGPYNKNDTNAEYGEHHIADVYCEYMVAETMRHLAEHEIAICNKKVSRAIRKARSLKLLRVRASVEKRLYYCYRFVSEFSGKSITKTTQPAMYNRFMQEGSFTNSDFMSISKSTSETKHKIDAMLDLLNDSAEYQTAKSNMWQQWIMLIITVLSLILAVLALTDMKLKDIWILVCTFFGKG